MNHIPFSSLAEPSLCLSWSCVFVSCLFLEFQRKRLLLWQTLPQQQYQTPSRELTKNCSVKNRHIRSKTTWFTLLSSFDEFWRTFSITNCNAINYRIKKFKSTNSDEQLLRWLFGAIIRFSYLCRKLWLSSRNLFSYEENHLFLCISKNYDMERRIN